MIGAIIYFRGNAQSLAAQWCFKNDVPGEVVGEEAGLLEIDVGLYYNIYAKPDQVWVVDDDTELSGRLDPLPPELQAAAPIPEEF